MKRTTLVLVLLAAAGVMLAMIVAAALLLTGRLGPLKQEALSQPRIYAYRDWQSIGLYVTPGQRLYIRARGTWLYTPGEYHGPEGHAIYPAPDTYPVNAVAGGILLGRFGEDGYPFIVGRGASIWVDKEGWLYLRINDDILTDNEGYVTVEVTVTEAE